MIVFHRHIKLLSTITPILIKANQGKITLIFKIMKWGRGSSMLYTTMVQWQGWLGHSQHPTLSWLSFFPMTLEQHCLHSKEHHSAAAFKNGGVKVGDMGEKAQRKRYGLNN